MLGQCVALGPCSSWHCSVAVISIPGRGMLREEEEEEVLSAMGGWLEKQELEGELCEGGKEGEGRDEERERRGGRREGGGEEG